MNKFMKGFCIFASAYTLITVISSIIQLVGGVQNDTNIHLLARAIITFVPIFMYFALNIGKECGLLKSIVKVAVHYVFCLGAAMLTVYLIGFSYTLAKSAYTDIFLNFSIVYIIVAAVFIIVYRQGKRKKA